MNDTLAPSNQETSVVYRLGCVIGMFAASALAGPTNAASGIALDWIFGTALPVAAGVLGVVTAFDSASRRAFLNYWRRGRALSLLITCQVAAVICIGWLVSALLINRFLA